MHDEPIYEHGPDVVARRLGDETVLFQTSTNNIFQLNETGSRLWELLAVPTTLSNVRQLLLSEYDTDSATLEDELQRVINELLAAELLRERFETPAATASMAPEADRLHEGWFVRCTLGPDHGVERLELRVAPHDVEPTHYVGVNHHIVFAGQLHNAQELSHALGLTKRPANDDARVVAEALQRWGEAALERLRGAFAFVAWDRRRHTLLCVRDPVGVFPLFYREHDGRIIVSTSIEALRSEAGVTLAPRRIALAAMLCRLWTDAEETYFEGVRRVPPGHVLIIRNGSRRLYRYWDPLPLDSDAADHRWAGEEETARFEELLKRAVARCLRFGQAGVLLSGGLDSVSVATVAKALSRDDELPLALSLVFPHPDCDEEAIQREVAQRLGLPQIIVPLGQALGGRGLLDAALELASRLSAPLQNVWAPAYVDLQRRAREAGCALLLSGGGGDEWLGVTPMLAADLLRTGKMLEVLQLCRTGARFSHHPPWTVYYRTIWSFGLRALARERFLRSCAAWPPSGRARSAIRRWREWRCVPRWISGDPALRRELEQRAEQSWLNSRAGRLGHYLYEARRPLDHPLISIELEEVYALARRAGLYQLQPYWDADLLELLLRVPPALLNQQGQTKSLVRQMLAQHYHSLAFERQKKVTAIDFFRTIVREQGPVAWRRFHGLRQLTAAGVVERDSATYYLDDIVAGGVADGAGVQRIWDLLSLEAWLGGIFA